MPILWGGRAGGAPPCVGGLFGIRLVFPGLGSCYEENFGHHRQADLKQKMLAMELAIGCLFFRDGSTGRAGDDRVLYTASPLHAVENEWGVQDPVGFWGPVLSLQMGTR